MSKISRRAIAAYAADQLLAGQTARRLAKDIVALLIESNRQGELEFLIDDIAWELESRKALVSAKVLSANPISQALENEIKKMLKAVTGAKEITLTPSIDKKIIGGVRIDTAGKVWDFTTARQLAELREVF